MSRPKFFATRAQWRRWLERNHQRERELVVGFYKKATGKPSIDYEESVEEALCFGWIDGVRRRIDDEAYSMRFTPRQPKTYWSTVNLERFERLLAEGKVAPAGMAAYERRETDVDRRYSFERDTIDFTPEQTKAFERNRKAWAFFQSQPPGYRRTATWWVVSFKREATREAHLRTLIEHSERGERLPQVQPAGGR